MSGIDRDKQGQFSHIICFKTPLTAEHGDRCRSAQLDRGVSCRAQPRRRRQARHVGGCDPRRRYANARSAGRQSIDRPDLLERIYDQLLTFPGSDFSKVTSDVATKWDVSADGLTYVFELNPNIKFSDGTPATADDVVFSLKRQKNLKGPAWFQDGVTSVEKTGGNEVTIKLSSLNVDWLFLLTSPFLSIAQVSAIKQNGSNDSAKDQRPPTRPERGSINIALAAGPSCWKRGSTARSSR